MSKLTVRQAMIRILSIIDEAADAARADLECAEDEFCSCEPAEPAAGLPERECLHHMVIRLKKEMDGEN